MQRFKDFLLENDIDEVDLCGHICDLDEDAPLSKKEAHILIGGKPDSKRPFGLSSPSKMPCHGYALPASECKSGSKLAKIEGSVCNKCYAKRGNYTLPDVKTSHARRLESIKHPRWAEAMTTAINHTGEKYFRWHDSGDIQSPEHLSKIAEVAKNTPHVQHWLPTKEHKMVSDWLKTNHKPDNLNIRVSANMVNAPHPSWPAAAGLTTSGVHTDPTGPAGQHHDCPAHLQGNECGTCRACWNPKVKSVSYLKH